MCYSKKNGTYDIFGFDSIVWNDIINKITKVCDIYNYKYIKTPIFESTELFHELIGKETDVVSKELYKFFDNNNDEISLRPEGTTGVVRSYLENKLYKNKNITKFYYYGSMFRQEKVEEGRFREFQQFGVEVFNSNSYMVDVEIISLAVNIFKELGLKDIVVYINNLGNKNEKVHFEKVIKEYFKPHLNNLCDDCKRRFKENPIRILDCKLDKRKDIVLKAPKIEDFINIESKERFEKIINSLNNLNIKYVVNKNLVRGLNYYTDTVFEIKTNIDGYGARNTICGGGRYNNSVITDEKDYIPAMGFAIGLERLIDILSLKNLLINNEQVIDFNLMFENMVLLNELRNLGYKSDYNSNDMAKYTIYEENNSYVLKDNINNKQINLDNDTLLKKIVDIC